MTFDIVDLMRVLIAVGQTLITVLFIVIYSRLRQSPTDKLASTAAQVALGAAVFVFWSVVVNITSLFLEGDLYRFLVVFARLIVTGYVLYVAVCAIRTFVAYDNGKQGTTPPT